MQPKAKAPRAETPSCWVSVKHCPCGKGTGQYLAHYDLVRCSCGQMYWALRPERDGPLKAYPWPGPTLPAHLVK